MKLLLLAFLIALFNNPVFAQQSYLDSLHQQLKKAKEDTNKVIVLSELGKYYGFNQFDSAIYYGQQTIALANKLTYDYGNFLGLRCLFFAYNCQGNYPKALEVTLENLKVAEKIKKSRPFCFTSVQYCLGLLNRQMNNFPVAISQLKSSLELNRAAGQPDAEWWPAYSQLALIHLALKHPDSALWYANRGYDLSLQPNIWSRFVCLSSAVLGFVHTTIGNYEQAKSYLSKGIQESKKVNNIFFLAWNYNLLANVFRKTNVLDSCIYYASISLPLWRAHNFGAFAVNASSLLTEVYELQKRPDSTIKYMKIMLAAKDSVFNQTKVKEFEKFVFDEEQRKQEIQKQQEQYRNKIRIYALVAGIIILLFAALAFWRNSMQRQKAKKKIEKAYEELKATQQQLVHQEKMASLGELTAGIAHEIQNPLNFVNNFSEVNKELIEEVKSQKSKLKSEELDELLNDLADNEEKINQHGKRADAIVKNMLQHSRISTGQKEPTDINALADEYLRLAYHGMRAKDKSFNATLQTDFDSSIGKINIVPQDIGRVLLNLYNNAFYAVSEKKKQHGENYEPIISVITKKHSDKVTVSVRDNGNGIPASIKEKIFQPFFTTKPTGQGTGLGLSLAYDTIKAHGGEIKVETKGGEGSEFIIRISNT